MPTCLCRVDEIADGTARGFAFADAPRDAMFVVRSGDTVRAWLNACPHVEGAPLAWRKDAYLSADGRAIVCYGHGAVFDLETGVCIQGACLGQRLTPVSIARDAQDMLWLLREPVSQR
jgi:nitrite reductase/ring-hydroxylating ferredoxin subunit